MRHRPRTNNGRRTGEQHRLNRSEHCANRSSGTHHDDIGDRLIDDRAGDNDDDDGSGANHAATENCKATDQSKGAGGSLLATGLRIRRTEMSTATPMTTADREARYFKQNGGSELTSRQQRQIRKERSTSGARPPSQASKPSKWRTRDQGPEAGLRRLATRLLSLPATRHAPSESSSKVGAVYSRSGVARATASMWPVQGRCVQPR
jgi:hypothetical protein